MHKIKEYQARKNKLFRFRSLKSIFSSLLLTTAVVSTIVISIPTSALAKIEKLDTFENTVVYTLNITDEDNSIVSGSLKVDLISDFGDKEKKVDLGKSVGAFYNLEPNTEYTMNITADKGYGEEILDSETFVTSANNGGAITGIELLSDTDEFQLDYAINYLIHDDNSEFKQFKLVYTYSMSGEDFQNHEEIILDKSESVVQINGIYNYNTEINLILEGITYNDEVQILDNQTFSTPYKIFGYIDLMQLTSNSALLHIGTDYNLENVLGYEVALYKSDRVVRKESINILDNQETDFHEQFETLEFQYLYANSTYRAELSVKYQDPYTLKTEDMVVSTVDFTTLKKYNNNIEVTEYPLYYQVDITLSDKENIYNQGYYEIFDKSYSTDYPIENGYFDYQMIDGKRHIIFTVDKPMDVDYIIKIGIASSNNYIYYKVLKTFEVE